MLKKVVVGRREAGRVWQMWPNFLVEFIQLLQRRLCNLRSNIVMEKFWSVSVEQRRAQTLEFQVNFVDFLIIFLNGDGVARIQGVVMDKTGCEPPYSHHNFVLVQIWFGKCCLD